MEDLEQHALKELRVVSGALAPDVVVVLPEPIVPLRPLAATGFTQRLANPRIGQVLGSHGLAQRHSTL